MGLWRNNDGLIVKFGPTEAEHSEVGAYMHPGRHRLVEAKVDLTALAGTASDPKLLSETVKFPKGAIIEKVEVLTGQVEVDGSSAVLDMGFAKLDRTELDYDGLLDGLTEAVLDDGQGTTYTFTEGTESTAGGAAGVLVGAALSEAAYLTAQIANNSNPFTAGELMVRVFYSVPVAA